MRVFGIAILLFVAVALTFGLSRACSTVEEAADVAQEQLGPRALLKKYEWFKTAASELDAKLANLKASQKRMDDLARSYGKTAREKWSREDREQYNLWSSEVTGITANYNGLAAEYNAAMAKINWSFTNVGQLPAGASGVLPREFRKYEEGDKP